MYDQFYRPPSKLKKVFKWGWGFIAGFLVLIFNSALVILLLVTWPIETLWNSCLAGTFSSVPHLSFWTTLGLLVLFRLIKVAVK